MPRLRPGRLSLPRARRSSARGDWRPWSRLPGTTVGCASPGPAGSLPPPRPAPASVRGSAIRASSPRRPRLVMNRAGPLDRRLRILVENSTAAGDSVGSWMGPSDTSSKRPSTVTRRAAGSRASAAHRPALPAHCRHCGRWLCRSWLRGSHVVAKATEPCHEPGLVPRPPAPYPGLERDCSRQLSLLMVPCFAHLLEATARGDEAGGRITSVGCASPGSPGSLPRARPRAENAHDLMFNLLIGQMKRSDSVDPRPPR
jgi:hypothetical protein